MKGFKLGLLANIAYVTVIAAPAYAGFQWTAPTDNAGIRAPQTQAAPRVQAAPVAPVISENLAAGNLPSSLGDIAPNAPSYVPGSSDDPLTWNPPANKTTSPMAVPTAPVMQQAPQMQAAPRAPMAATPQASRPNQMATSAEGVYIPRNPHAAHAHAATQAPQSVLPNQAMNPIMQQAPQNMAAQAVATPNVAAPYYTPPMGNAQPNTAPIPNSAPTDMQSQTAVNAPMGNGSYSVAEGFGSDLPLVMAIRQIVPSDYGFVFDDGIDLAAQVSWQGGQPWNMVLQDVLNPLALRAQIQGNVISIVPAHKGGFVENTAVEAVVVSENVIENGSGVVNASAPAPILAQAAYVPAKTGNLYQTAILEEEFIAGPILASATRPDLHAKTVWTAPRNSTLRGILQDWANRAGVELYWASEFDYPVQSAVTINGSFEEAVQVLLRGLSESKPRPLGRLHPNLPDGPAVLLIETRESSM